MNLFENSVKKGYICNYFKIGIQLNPKPVNPFL